VFVIEVKFVDSDPHNAVQINRFPSKKIQKNNLQIIKKVCIFFLTRKQRRQISFNPPNENI